MNGGVGFHVPVYISHSFENKAEFDNIVGALKHEGVPYWDPAEIKAGLLLREQLRQAVEECAVCIFVATHESGASSWCSAEMGAFWGAGKPVLVYLADSSLKEQGLPDIVKGDVWEQNMWKVAARAKELLATTKPTVGDGATDQPEQVGSMTATQLEKLIVGAVSLALATTKNDGHAATPEEINQAAQDASGSILRGAQAIDSLSAQPEGDWQRQILWVDDRPNNNVYERRTLESLGFQFTLALSTKEALETLDKRRFAAIISDMGRREGPREGYVLLEALRARDRQTPFFIYAGSNAPQHKQEAAARGAQGSTNNARDLVDMMTQALRSSRAERQ
jgi:CheY-like chemotaxis protein